MSDTTGNNCCTAENDDGRTEAIWEEWSEMPTMQWVPKLVRCTYLANTATGLCPRHEAIAAVVAFEVAIRDSK